MKMVMYAMPFKRSRKVNGGVGKRESKAYARFVCIRYRAHRLDIYARLVHQGRGLLSPVVQQMRSDAFEAKTTILMSGSA